MSDATLERPATTAPNRFTTARRSMFTSRAKNGDAAGVDHADRSWNATMNRSNA